MIGFDTNVLARIVLADDVQQTSEALKLLKRCEESGEAVAISLTVILELEWVLRSAARLRKANVVAVFRQLLETEPLAIENEAALEHALYLYESENVKADFAECLFLAQYQRMGSRVMASFDVKAQEMLHVVAPSQV